MPNNQNINPFSDSIPSEEFAELVTTYLEGQASEAEISKLGEELKESDLKRQYFNEICLHTRLIAEVISPEFDNLDNQQPNNQVSNEFAEVSGHHEEKKMPSNLFGKSLYKVGRFITKPTPLSMSLAALILVSFLTTLALISISINRESSDATDMASNDTKAVLIATVSELRNCYWNDDSAMPRSGEPLRQGDLISLKKGLIKIQFNSGATVNLQGPAKFRLNSPLSVTMLAGISTFHVPPSATGFAVETAAVKVVDLGTRFGVSINGEESTSVHVFKGKVAATSLGSDGKAMKTIELTKGQAAKFNINSAQPSQFVASEHEFSKLRLLGQATNYNAWKSHVAELIKDDDLVGYWSFDNENVKDQSKKVNHGNVIGRIRYSTLIPAAIGGGKSLNLSGAGNSVRIAHSKSISDMDAMTIAFWMKSPVNRISDTNVGRVFDKEKNNQSGWKLRNDVGTNSFLFNIYSKSQDSKFTLGAAIDGNWHHFTITIDQTYCHVYVDGKLTKKTSLPSGMKFNSTEDLMIGAATNVTGPKRFEFDGYLDEIFIFKKVLSPKQLKQFIFP